MSAVQTDFPADSIELRSANQAHSFLEPIENPVVEYQQQQLKPVDGGKDAWVVLIAGFIFEALFWGFPMSFGVFQNYYSEIPDFKDRRADIALIGTVSQALLYLGAPISAGVTKRYPRYQRYQIWVGWPLCIVGLLSASFATSVNGLIQTQGLLYGLGFVTLTFPIISMLNEWWVVRKGMAFGLISASSGATGIVMPFLLNYLLSKYGYRTTLRASAIAMIILTAPLLPLFHGRLPPSRNTAAAKFDFSIFKKPLFWVYGLSILAQGLGFFFPLVFLPSYAASIGLTNVQGALLLALMCVAQVFGQLVFGFLSDRKVPVSLLAVTCCMLTTASSLGLWGLARSMPALVAFSLVYGFFAFGFGTMRVGMGRAVSGDAGNIFASFAIFVFLQGVGNILVGPLSAALMKTRISSDGFGVGKYSPIIILTGASSFFSASILVTWHFSQYLLKDRGRVVSGQRS